MDNGDQEHDVDMRRRKGSMAGFPGFSHRTHEASRSTDATIIMHESSGVVKRSAKMWIDIHFV